MKDTLSHVMKGLKTLCAGNLETLCAANRMVRRVCFRKNTVLFSLE